MTGRNLLTGLSYIDQTYIAESEGVAAEKIQRKKALPRAFLIAALIALMLLLVGCGIAYAANLFGWSCAITESLSDSSTVMATVTIRGGNKYIVAPTDADPDQSVGIIGIAGEQTLSEYAASQGKKLLLVGASILKVGDEEIGGGSQRMENISESEMVILTRCNKTVSASNPEAVCLVYAREEDSNEVQRVELPFVLSEAPAASEGEVYHPLNPNAIPGLTVRDMTVTETPLGYNIRMSAIVTDQEASYNIMKVEIEGLTYGEGSHGSEDDGNWYFDAYMCQGTLEGILVVHYYDCDKQPIGEIEFRKVIYP